MESIMHDYNRGVRTHKHLYEALMKLAWVEFMRSGVAQWRLFLNRWIHWLIIWPAECPVLPQVMTIWRDFLNHLRENNGELSALCEV